MTPPATAASSAPNLQTQPQPAQQQLIDPPKEHGVVWPPSDLYSDEPPLETTLHLQQMMLLLNCLHWLWQDRDDYFAAGNLTVYYSPQERKDRDFRGPDFFVALDTEPHPRKSWMIWEEGGKYPNVIVELLSESTAEVDRTLKKELYSKTFRTPEYFWFDPDSQEFEGFALLRGNYEPIKATEEGWLWSEQLQLYLGVFQDRLRYFHPDKTLVPTPEESAITAQEKATSAQQKAESAQKRADKLAEKLKELGVDPNTLD